VECLEDERSTGDEDLLRELKSRLRKRVRPQLVGQSMARCGRRHVTQNDIDLACKGVRQTHHLIAVEEIEAEMLGALDRLHLGSVERDHTGRRVAADTFDRDLGPAAGRGAKIDDTPPAR
jgi:hypothetical protein